MEGVVADLAPANAEKLLSGFDLILDGTDNFEARRLLNDVAVKHRRPWIYGAVVGSYGVAMAVVPGQTACFNCLTEGGAAAVEETCDTLGVINPAVSWVAALQVNQALQLLVGKWSLENARLHRGDLWRNEFHSSPAPRPRPDCRTCGARDFIYLAGEGQPQITLCGRNAVQISGRSRQLDLDRLGRRLATYGEVHQNPFLLRLRVPPYEVTLFSDGRAIIGGTTDPAIARSLYARYVGA